MVASGIANGHGASIATDHLAWSEHVPGDAEVALREREDLRGLHAEDESLAAAFVLEGAVPYLPLPAPVPLRPPFLGQASEQVSSVTRTALPSTDTSRPRSQSLRPVARRTFWFASMLTYFCSGDPVEKE